MCKERIRYVAKDQNEFKYLENSMDLFLKNYVFRFNSVNINVESGFEKSVIISPSSEKGGRIEAIAAGHPHSIGMLRSSTPEQVRIQIDKNFYLVNYNSETK